MKGLLVLLFWGTTNPSGQAVGGAVVELLKIGITDTTEEDGMYAFSQSVGVKHSGGTGQSMQMTGGILKMRLSIPEDVEVKVYDTSGQFIKKE